MLPTSNEGPVQPVGTPPARLNFLRGRVFVVCIAAWLALACFLWMRDFLMVGSAARGLSPSEVALTIQTTGEVLGAVPGAARDLTVRISPFLLPRLDLVTRTDWLLYGAPPTGDYAWAMGGLAAYVVLVSVKGATESRSVRVLARRPVSSSYPKVW